MGAVAVHAGSRRLGLAAGRWPGFLVYAGVLAAVVGGRGFVLARLMGGRYPLGYLLYDVAAFGTVIAGLRLFDHLVRHAVERRVGDGTRRRRVATGTLHAAIVIAIAFPFILVTLQLHPLRIAPAGTPRGVGLSYAEVSFVADNLRLSGWFVPATEPKAPVVLIAHGFNANKENFLLPAVMVHQLGYDTLLFDFRSHGDSDGHTSTFGLREAADVKAAHDWIVATHPKRPVYALAYSMGGSAVIQAAARYGIFDRIVLDSTFASLEDVARRTLLRPFGPLAGPLWTVGRFWAWAWSGADLDDHRPEARMAALASRPLMLIHGTGDRLIPYSQALRLHEATGRRAELWLIERAGHAETVDAPGYRDRLARFFDS